MCLLTLDEDSPYFVLIIGLNVDYELVIMNPLAKWGWFPVSWPSFALLLILESFVVFFWLLTTYFDSHIKGIGVQIFIVSSMSNFDRFLFYWGRLFMFMCQHQWDSSRARCYVCSLILRARHHSAASVSHGLGVTLWLGLICRQCIYCL